MSYWKGMVVVRLSMQGLLYEEMPLNPPHCLKHPFICDPTGNQMVPDHSLSGEPVVVVHPASSTLSTAGPSHPSRRIENFHTIQVIQISTSFCLDPFALILLP